MRLELTEEQSLLRDSVRVLLETEYSFAQRQESLDRPDACRPALWRQFADLGWLMLPLPEASGGLGGGLLEIGLLMAEFGERLVVEPYLDSAVVAGRLLAALGGAEAEDWLGRTLEGQVRAVLAHTELGMVDPYARPRCRATRASGGGERNWVLEGRKTLVGGAPGASAFLVSASTGDALDTGVFLVLPEASGLSIHPVRRVDGSMAADLRFDGVRAVRLGRDDADALPALQRALAHGIVAACWNACGAMTAAFQGTAAYTSARHQFGHPLAKFQVVQHRLAEMMVACEEARAACQLAALRIDARPTDLRTAIVAAASARSKVGRAAKLVAQEAVQLHGGMGVCEELPIAATFRLLTGFGQALGSTAWHGAHLGRLQLAGSDWRGSATLMKGDREAA